MFDNNSNIMNCFEWNEQGLDALGKKDYKKASECFKKSLEVNEDYLIAWSNIGTTYLKLMQFENALECYDKRLESDPMDTNTLNQKGLTLKKLEKIDFAIDVFDEIISIDPFDTAPWINKGIIFESQNNLEKCIECYDKALEIEPNKILAWTNKRIAYANQGQTEKAEECEAKIKEIESNKEKIVKDSQSVEFLFCISRLKRLQKEFNHQGPSNGKDISEKAAYIFRKTIESRLLNYDSTGVFNYSLSNESMSTCFYIAHLDEAITIDIEQLCKFSKVSKEKILENTKLLTAEFNLKFPKDQQNIIP